MVVIGGGFFGMYISEHLAYKGYQVILYEKESDFMQRASYRNQARVHNGYHYPRSTLTALRSKLSFPKFAKEFESCIDSSFDQYYMISSILSKTSSNQFLNFCHRIGIICNPAPKSIISLTNPYFVEDIFSVKEFVFDSQKLKKLMIDRIQNVGVESRLNRNIQSIKRKNKRLIVSTYSLNTGENEIIDTDMVFNCTYSMTNNVINNSELNFIPLKHEMAEIILTQVPEELHGIGITVMDGPFFSIMPFPSKGIHTLSHVRYTPHYEWVDINKKNYKSTDKHLNEYKTKFHRRSSWTYMIKDASRYIPLLSKSKYIESILEVKTILPMSENCDSRPILFKMDHGLKGFHNVIGGKIDNIYDIIKVIEKCGF